MKKTSTNIRLSLASLLVVSLTACSGGGGGSTQYSPSWSLSITCQDPSDGDSQVVAGNDVQFIYTLNNTSSSSTPNLSLVSATDTVLGDIASQFPSSLPQGTTTVTITYPTSTSGDLSVNSTVNYQLSATSNVLSKTASASCTVLYPDPSNPSVFPTQSDNLEGTSGDNTPATATTETVGDTSYHSIYPLEDEDWIKIDLTGGTEYEFSVDNVSYNGYPLLELYSASDTTTPITQDSSYFASNPRILYTPSSSGTYYLKVTDYAFGISSYTLSSRIFSDGDTDTYSPHYDCVDTNANIYPWQVDTGGDGVDQSCSGYDWLDSASPDSYEPDNNFASAGTLPMFGGDPFDIIHRGDVYSETHTLHSSDVDVFKITVPANTAYEIFDVETNGVNFDYTLYASDTVTSIDSQTSSAFIYEYLDNTASATPTDFYFQIKTTNVSDTATYVLGVGNIGADADGDGHFTHSQGVGWDCNDSDPNIYGGAAETANDGIDSNCNGKDNS